MQFSPSGFLSKEYEKRRITTLVWEVVLSGQTTYTSALLQKRIHIPGQDFEKTWLIKNTGTCTWGEGYHLVFGYDSEMNGQARPLPAIISPDETAEVTVVFKAPLETGEYKSYWRMANTKGANFGEFFYVFIVVR